MKLFLLHIPRSFTALGAFTALAAIASTTLVACGAREADLLPKRQTGDDAGLIGAGDGAVAPAADGGPIDQPGCTTEARNPQAIGHLSSATPDSIFRHLEVGDSSWFAHYYDPGHNALHATSDIVTGLLAGGPVTTVVSAHESVNQFALQGAKPDALYLAGPNTNNEPVLMRRDLATDGGTAGIAEGFRGMRPVAIAADSKGVVWGAANGMLFRHVPGWFSGNLVAALPGIITNIVMADGGDIYVHVRPANDGKLLRDTIFATHIDAQLPETPLAPYIVYEAQSDAITGLAVDSTHLYFYELTQSWGAPALIRLDRPAPGGSAPPPHSEVVATLKFGWVPESIAIGRSYIAWRAHSGGVACVRPPCPAAGTIWLKQKNLAGGAEEIPVTDEPLQGGHRVAFVGRCDALVWTEQATIMRR